MSSRRSPDNHSGTSSSSSGQPKKAQWFTLAQWAANRSSSTETSLSSTILKTSDQEPDETRGGPSEPDARSRRRLRTSKPKRGDDGSFSARRRESAELNRRRGDGSSSEAGPAKKTPHREHGGSSESTAPSPAAPTGEPQGSTRQGSFWSRPYLRGEHGMRPLGRVSSPASTGGQSFRTASHPPDDSPMHAGPIDSPGPSGRQSLEAAPYPREDSPWRRSPSSSSQQGVAPSAKASAPSSVPESNEPSGARQPEASPQRSSRSTENVRSPRPEEPRDNRASTSPARMSDVTKANTDVGGTSEILERSASRPSGQPGPQQGAMKKARVPPGYRVYREIVRLQSKTRKLIPRRAFARVVREILQRHATDGHDFAMQTLALEALHEASEAVLVQLLEGTNTIAHNARRVTIMPRDMRALLTIIRGHGNMQGSLSE
ncbi:hypothetical protein HPB51_021954 [Rhipicephalus microplus]|uniref:Core Histone H2A/H2B/H3 domain-containing protein n=1 Tax=Rhipicephalus microplus TaxID=6941 RepID=A0A9J6EIE9_RHIMP|nr:hypothetical protein HPB51_021954 [Rhipicephalus microplus]